MSSGTRETLPDFSHGFVSNLPYELVYITMGKPNSCQPLELLGKYMHPKVEYNTLPKYIIEEFVPVLHNGVGTPWISSRKP
jgi:hypothetical protein